MDHMVNTGEKLKLRELKNNKRSIIELVGKVV